MIPRKCVLCPLDFESLEEEDRGICEFEALGLL